MFLNDWYVLYIPLLVMIITQLIKVVVDVVKAGKFDMSLLAGYGGMPSSHTALFVSAATVIGMSEGFDSAVFALAIFVTVMVIRDAMGVRHSLNDHGKALNALISRVPEHEQKELPTQLNERLGHTPFQVLIGGLVGAGLTVLLVQVVQ